ncbi:MAG: lamin tail domain-containing protein [Roseibacillus sp.]
MTLKFLTEPAVACPLLASLSLLTSSLTAEPIDLTVGTAAHSTGYETGNEDQFPASLAIDGVTNNFTHTRATDDDPTWQVLLPESKSFGEIKLLNRNGGAAPRLRDITVYVVEFNGNLGSDFNGGTIVYTSELQNPGPNADTVTEIIVDAGGATGNMIRVKRTPEAEISNNARVLSLNEVTAEDPERIISFESDRTLVTSGDTVSLSWEVSDNLTSLQINNGVGDVLTDPDESVDVIAPSATTDYELTAINPSGTSTAIATIEVTNQPLIYSYDSDAGDSLFVEAGTNVNLSWEVGSNATSLTLNGTDVLGSNGISVSPTEETEYLLEASNSNGTVSRTLFLRPVEDGVPIISEFLASNDQGILDEDGDPSDWIELYNPGTSSLSLAGYFLSDDVTDLTKWMLPNVTLAAGEYLVVFASGKNRVAPDPTSELHTNFLLSSAGEYLALTKTDGVSIITEYAPSYPEQEIDVSYGFDGVRGTEGYLATPTPGAANEASVLGFVADTSFSLDRGFYSTPIQVTVSSLTTDANIRYTLNGSKPTATTGILYTGPIDISETTVLRAAAFKDGFGATNVDTHTYIFPTDVITQPEMDVGVTQDPQYAPDLEAALISIPTISLNFDGEFNGSVSRDEKEVSVEMIGFEDGDTQADAGFSRFGGLVTNFDKNSMRFTFRSEYGPGKLDFQLWGGHEYSSFQPANEVNSFDLRAGNHDMAARGAYLSNRYSDDATLDMGHIAPHGRFVHVYIRGEYWGQYHLREGWDASMISEYYGGSKEDYEAVDANDNFQAQLTVYDGSGDFWRAGEVLAAGAAPFTNVRSHIDVINAIDFILLYVNGSCESEFRAAGSESREVPFKFFLKDADGYLRNPGGRNVLDDGPVDLMRELRDEGDPDFTTLVADRIHKHFFNNGALTPEKNIERLQDRVDETALSFLTEAARWGYRSPASFFSYHANLTDNFFPELQGNPSQTADMIAKFVAAGMYPSQEAPVYSQHGGEFVTGTGPTISVSDSNLEVYYLFDSADTNLDEYVNSLDPRLPGGVVSSAATMISFDGGGANPVSFVQEGDNWSYLADGSNQGTTWRDVSFDATSWGSGASPLGYGDGDEATDVGFVDSDPGTSGIQKNPTTYFRKSDINIPDPSMFEDFTLNYVFDDGVTIYLNGNAIPVARENVALNAAYDDYSTATSSENQFGSVTLPSTAFVAGNNTIAAEIHNRSATSSDISFDIELIGNPPGSSGGPVSEPIPVTFPGWLLSRTYNTTTGEWSALNAAFFTPEPIPADADNLVVSEFHYNPVGPSGSAEEAVAADGDEFEFLELMNVGGQPIDLEGVTISVGISFTFGPNNILPSGERLVIVENRDAFEVRYGGLANGIAFGSDSLGLVQYGGKLSNGGERLLIQDAAGSVIQDFTYDDVLPWPPAPDNGGFSLVLISPLELPDHTVATNWAASGQDGGSPGTVDSVGFVGDPSADADGDGLVALLEYALSSSDSVAGDSTIVATINSFLVEGSTENYLTIRYRRNLHTVNSVNIEAEVSEDLVMWDGLPDVVLVSETDNLDGTSTVIYRSALPVGDRISGKEFIRLRAEE